MVVQATSKSDCPATQHLLKSSRTLSNPGKQFKPSLWRQYQDSWYPEVTALTLSLFCIIAIAIILNAYNGQANPRMKWGLTLNAIISILATTSKVSLIFTISNSIGQLKWVWFLGQTPRSLRDAGIYDDASRGPLGSLILLWTEARGSFASIGAILTLLGLAYDPFVQQIVSFETVSQLQNDPATNAVMNTAHYFLVDQDLWTDPTGKTGFIRPAINAAYWSNDFTWNMSCPMQYCTWPVIETLALHSKCYEDKNWTLSEDCNLRIPVKDIENLPVGTVQALNCTASTATNSTRLAVSYTIQDNWGSEVWLEYFAAELTVASTFGVFPWNSLPSLNNLEPITSLSAFNLKLQDDASMLLKVTTCELDIFLDSYSLDSNGGRPIVNLVTTLDLFKDITYDNRCNGVLGLRLYPAVPSSPTFLSDEAPNTSANTFESSYDANCLLSLQYEAVAYLVTELTWAFPLQWNFSQSFRWTINQNDSSDTLYTKLIAGMQQAPGTGLGTNDYVYIWKNAGPEYVVNDMAASLTKIMFDPAQNINGTSPIYGRAWSPITVVRVAWPWVILPLGLCLATILFFVITAYVTIESGAPLWKSSINAFFYHGIDFDFGIQTQLATVPEMDAQAAITRAKLKPVGIFERLMLETTISKRE